MLIDLCCQFLFLLICFSVLAQQFDKKLIKFDKVPSQLSQPIETMKISIVALSLILTLARVCGFVRDDCHCGIAITEGRRITKGVLTKPFKYPWMVALFNSHKKAFCGAALISDRHV